MNDFIQYLHAVAQRKRADGKSKTAGNYDCSARALAKYLKIKGRASALPFSDFNPKLLESFEAYLLGACHISRNTSSFYMRSLRAVWNMARREGFAPQTEPFANVYTGIDRTRHRATADVNIKRLFTAELDDCRHLAFARDIFLFSFLGHGIAFVDIAKMLKRNLCQGYISYTRSKTGQHLTVRVTPAIDAIIQRWADPMSPYLLPIVKLPFSSRNYDNALHNYNRNLRQLAKRLGINDRLTSYTARHSWASEAYRLQVPISVISSCMGHTTENTTRIYLRSLDSEFIASHAAVVENYFVAHEPPEPGMDV